MTHNQVSDGISNSYGLPVPQAAAIRREAQRRLALTLRREELVWLVGERYDQSQSTWYFELARSGATGQWMRQRYRYDGQAETLYFLGESALSAQAFQALRATASIFQTADLQDEPA